MADEALVVTPVIFGLFDGFRPSEVGTSVFEV